MTRGEINRQAALRNIILKKEILQSWCESPPPGCSGMAEYYPKTVRQFNAWNLTQNSDLVRAGLPNIATNANDTLNKYPATRAEVKSVIADLNRINLRKAQKGTTLTKVKEELRELKMHTKVLEEELITLRLEYADWRKIRMTMQEKYESLLSEFHTNQSLAEKKYEKLMLQNASLTKTLSKLRVLEVSKK